MGWAGGLVAWAGGLGWWAGLAGWAGGLGWWAGLVGWAGGLGWARKRIQRFQNFNLFKRFFEIFKGLGW